MADNVAITPGSGATVAADDIGGVLYQRVKPTIGADGTAVDISAGAGAVGTGVQRMTLASDDPAVTLLTSIDDRLDPSSDPIPVTQSGSTVHRLLSAAADTNATSVKASAGKVYKLMGKVARTTDVFLKLYNKATAASEADTPVMTIALPGSSWFDLDLGGLAFATGISYRMVTAVADNSTAALTAGDIIAFNLSYT